MKRSRFVFLILVATSLVSAQDITHKISQVDPFLDTAFAEFSKPDHPGVAITVLKDGKAVARKAYGLASIEYAVPFSHSTVVRLPYSEGREFMAVAAVLMESEGMLKLDDKARSYFPELPAWSDPVTLRDLLNHRSGFVDECATLLLTQNAMSNRFEKDQFLQLLYRQPRPEVTPGKGYMYSNSDFGLLRLILEKAANENLRDYAKRKIFDPLGMTSTRYHDRSEEAIPNFAFSYMPGPRGRYVRWLRDKTSPGGNYYIATTAGDLEKWAQAHRDKTSSVARAVNRLMKDVQLMPGEGKNYVFGFKEKTIGKHRVWSHQGVNEVSYLAEVPSAGLSVVILSNEWTDIYPFQKRILGYLLNESQETFVNKTFAQADVTYDRKTLERFTGRYYSSDTVTYQSFTKDIKNLSEIVIVNDSLKWKWGNEILPLDYLRPGVFKDRDYPAYFEFTDSQPSQIRVHIHLANRIEHLIRDTRPAWKPAANDLQQFAGEYYSPHLNFYWRIEKNKDGKLVLIRPTIPDTILEPDTDGAFLMWIEQDPGVQFDSYIRFSKDKDGRVTHLDVTHNRLMGHQFNKVK